MNTMICQIKRGDEWRKLSSIEFDPNRETSRRIGDVTHYSRAGALKAGMSQMSAWHHHYESERIRLVERVGYAGQVNVIAGGK